MFKNFWHNLSIVYAGRTGLNQHPSSVFTIIIIAIRGKTGACGLFLRAGAWKLNIISAYFWRLLKVNVFFRLEGLS